MTTALKEYRLWPKTGWGNDVNIDTFGVSGDHASGKTTMGISIAPGKHPEGHPFAGKARTLVIDLEKSSTNYLEAGFDHVDAPVLIEQFARKNEPNKKGYTSLQMLNWFKEFITKLPSKEGTFCGQPAFRYDVIMVDPLNDLDNGVMNYVRQNPGEFDLTPNQASGSLAYGGVKKFWKQQLLLLAEKCRCFFFTTHMGTVWKHNEPTKERKVKGSSSLNEIATLRLTLERASSGIGERGVAIFPSAVVTKCRISDNRTVMDEFGIATLETRPLLPPRLPVATISEIRKLIAKPLDYADLDAEFQVPEAAPPTEEEMLEKRIELAEAEERAALAKQGIAKSPEPNSAPTAGNEPAVKKSYGKKSAASEPKPETSAAEPTETAKPDVPAETVKAETTVKPEVKPTVKPTWTRESAVQIIREGILSSKNPTGWVPAKDYTAYCTRFNVDAASKLSDKDLFELANRVDQVPKLKQLIEQAKVPQSVVSVTLEKAKVASLFELDSDTVTQFADMLRSNIAQDTSKN